MKTGTGIFLLCAIGATCLHAASSSPIAVDFSANGGRIIANPSAIGYGPDWAVATNAAGVTADLLVVSHVGENSVATQTLVSAAAAAGAHALSPAIAGAQTCRLVLRTKAGGATLGELVRDVSFGIVSAPSAPARVDVADDKLERALVAGESPALAYADWWADGVASLRIDLEGRRRGGSPVQREVFAAEAPASGVHVWSSPMKEYGDYELKLRFYDGSDNLVGTLSAAYAGFVASGTTILMR